PALEPGHRTPDRRILPPEDADVQRLRRPGRQPLFGHGLEEELLKLSDRTVRFVLKPLVFALSLGPFAWLVWAGLTGNLSANPLVYATGVLGVLHYWWLVKADVHRPYIYGAIVGVFLAFRVWWAKLRSA